MRAAHWLTHLDHDWHSPVWQHRLVDLSRNHRLVRDDERGCGLSDRDIPQPAFDEWVADLETVVDAAGLERFDLPGFSQGGAVSVAYAARHPQRVRRIVLGGAFEKGWLVDGDQTQGPVTTGFLARLLVEKFVLGQPAHRIVAALAHDGLDLAEGTLAGVFAAARTCWPDWRS